MGALRHAIRMNLKNDDFPARNYKDEKNGNDYSNNYYGVLTVLLFT